MVGVLDWGDAGYCWRVVEVAVAAAYAIIVAAGPPGSRDGGSGADGGAGDCGGMRGNGSALGGGEGKSVDDDESAILAAGRRVVEGYLSAGGPLTDGEAEVLPALAAARIAQSLINGAAAASAAPENSAYLLTTQRTGWSALRALQGLDEGALAAALLGRAQTGAQTGLPAAAV